MRSKFGPRVVWQIILDANKFSSKEKNISSDFEEQVDVRTRVEEIVYTQMRKYQYLFTTTSGI